MVLRTNVVSEAAQLTASAEDYWFTSDETTDSAINEVDALLGEADSDNSLGKLTFNSDPSEVLTSLDGMTKLDQSLSIAGLAKKKQQK